MIRAVLLASAPVFAANEIRGLILSAPVLYGLYLSGGTLMAVWIAFCSLAGIALSVAVPLFLAKKLHSRQGRAFDLERKAV